MVDYQFNVVEFIDSKKRDVGIISTRWIRSNAGEKGLTALWPSYTTDARNDKAVKAHEQPERDWSRHAIKILKTKGILHCHY